jgi:hypothetical protein
MSQRPLRLCPRVQRHRWKLAVVYGSKAPRVGRSPIRDLRFQGGVIPKVSRRRLSGATGERVPYWPEERRMVRVESGRCS